MEDHVVRELEARFHLSLDSREGALFSISAEELLNPAHMHRFLSCYARWIGASELETAATFFCSWFAYVALAQQYLLSVQNRSMDLSPDNFAVHVHACDPTVRLSFQIKRVLGQTLPQSEPERSKARLQALVRFYGITVGPMFEAVSAVGGIHVSHLWGQLPVRFYDFEQTLLAEVQEQGLRFRIIDDLQALAYEVDPVVFGRRKNPFDVKLQMVEDVCDPTRQVPLKSACCLYFQTEGGQYCYTCPRMREEERQAWRETFRERMKASSP